MKDCFGSSLLSVIGSKPIICSGVSAGSTAAVLRYTQMMSDIILSDESHPSTGSKWKEVVGAAKFPTCERNGVDQGVHNVLLHHGVLEEAKISIKTWQQSSSPVANMQAKVAILRVIAALQLIVAYAHFSFFHTFRGLIFESYNRTKWFTIRKVRNRP